MSVRLTQATKKLDVHSDISLWFEFSGLLFSSLRRLTYKIARLRCSLINSYRKTQSKTVTIRKWENAGKIKAAGITPGGQRFFDLTEISNTVESTTKKVLIPDKPTIGYARIYSHDQNDDLEKI